jgi:hypothetical protein
MLYYSGRSKMNNWERVDSIIGICNRLLTPQQFKDLMDYIQNCEYAAYDNGYQDGRDDYENH